MITPLRSPDGIPLRHDPPATLDDGEDGELVDVASLARLLFCHVNTAKRIKPADLPYSRITERGDRRYRLGDIRAYVASRRVG